MGNCTCCGGRLKAGAGPTHDDCSPGPGREPKGSARREVVAFSLTPEHVVKLDRLRGALGRSAWLQSVIDRS